MIEQAENNGLRDPAVPNVPESEEIRTWLKANASRVPPGTATV